MFGVPGNKGSDAKRSVLGFDGGCWTCSEIARRVEEQIGDKLEVRSFRDLQVREWRRTALGEDAPWAQTLMEIEGPKVRAWTGRRMGFALSRVLGPIATWRVMQVLGELGLAEKAEELPIGAVVAGMNRAQFLKGVAGAAVAMSVLPGSALFPSDAEAKQGKSKFKDATPEQREKAIAIVRDSGRYKKLKEEQERDTGDRNATFDFDKAVVR